jgi:error-prone DNA polymerase
LSPSLIDQSDLRNGLGGRDKEIVLASGRGDEAKHGGHDLDSREPKLPPSVKPRAIYVPDLRIDTLKVKAPNFR